MAKSLHEYSSIGLCPESLKGRVDFGQMFGRSAPVQLEIGSGKGTFLVSEAQACPDLNFFGIEWASKYYRYAVDRLGRRKLTNVRLIRTDATGFLCDFVADQSINGIHVYYPDPWPKKRHHKRRFICPDNVDQILRVLETGGQLKIATDHADYFEHMQIVLRAYASRLRGIEFRPTAGAQGGEWVGTNFERKYQKEERRVFTMALEKAV
jgi:tRNA (guanine-N7-)-methyltransferase